MNSRLLQSHIILITMYYGSVNSPEQYKSAAGWIQTAMLCAEPLNMWNGAGGLCVMHCPTGDGGREMHVKKNGDKLLFGYVAFL